VWTDKGKCISLRTGTYIVHSHRRRRRAAICRSQWPRSQDVGLKSRAEIVGLNPTGEAWTSVCCECCMLSRRGLCDELITHPKESYRLWCVVRDLEKSWIRRHWPTGGGGAVVSNLKKSKLHYITLLFHWNQHQLGDDTLRTGHMPLFFQNKNIQPD
jgi:hypothetical protein